MPQTAVMANTASITEIKGAFSRFVNRAEYSGKRTIVTGHGRPRAALISMEDLELLEAVEDALIATEAIKAHQAGETLPWEEVKAKLLAKGSHGISR